MDDNRNVTLRELHRYYAEEARHQRSMMWETAKWFILILGVVFGASFTGILNQYDPKNDVPAWIILVPMVIGYIISLTCITLISSFYKTNLISLSTLIKIEGELNFDDRNKFSSFRNDKFITWQEYHASRDQATCSQEFVRNNLKFSPRRIHTLISSVFVLFAIGFAVLTFPILSKANMLEDWIVILTVVSYSLLFVFACFVLREIRKIK
jgi:hypothetical protein